MRKPEQHLSTCITEAVFKANTRGNECHIDSEALALALGSTAGYFLAMLPDSSFDQGMARLEKRARALRAQLQQSGDLGIETILVED